MSNHPSAVAATIAMFNADLENFRAAIGDKMAAAVRQGGPNVSRDLHYLQLELGVYEERAQKNLAALRSALPVADAARITTQPITPPGTATMNTAPAPSISQADLATFNLVMGRKISAVLKRGGPGAMAEAQAMAAQVSAYEARAKAQSGTPATSTPSVSVSIGQPAAKPSRIAVVQASPSFFNESTRAAAMHCPAVGNVTYDYVAGLHGELRALVTQRADRLVELVKTEASNSHLTMETADLGRRWDLGKLDESIASVSEMLAGQLVRTSSLLGLSGLTASESLPAIPEPPPRLSALTLEQAMARISA